MSVTPAASNGRVSQVATANPFAVAIAAMSPPVVARLLEHREFLIAQSGLAADVHEERTQLHTLLGIDHGFQNVAHAKPLKSAGFKPE